MKLMRFQHHHFYFEDIKRKPRTDAILVNTSTIKNEPCFEGGLLTKPCAEENVFLLRHFRATLTASLFLFSFFFS